MLYATGARVSEVTGIQMDWINLEYGYVKCRGKGSKGNRIVPLGTKGNRGYSKLFKSFQAGNKNSQHSSYLFLSKAGKQLREGKIYGR